MVFLLGIFAGMLGTCDGCLQSWGGDVGRWGGDQFCNTKKRLDVVGVFRGDDVLIANLRPASLRSLPKTGLASVSSYMVISS